MTRNRRSIGAVVLLLGLSAGGFATAPLAKDQDKEKVMKYEEAERLVKAHIAIFDDLDFNVFTNQRWTELHRSHSQDVLVHWPDGHTTNGIEKHIQDLAVAFETDKPYLVSRWRWPDRFNP